MDEFMNEQRLEEENLAHMGTGGRSQENSDAGFRAAFFDYASQKLYLSRFKDGRIATMTSSGRPSSRCRGARRPSLKRER